MSSENGQLGTFEDIMGAQDLPCEEILVPEWGGKYYRFRGMNGTERAAWERKIAQARTGPGGALTFDVPTDLAVTDLKIFLVGMTLVDANGLRVFPQDKIEMLGRKSTKALDRCYEVAARLSGITPEAVEEAGKGSDATASPEASTPSVAS